MPRYFRDSLLVGADFDVDLISGSGVRVSATDDQSNKVARYTLNAGAVGLVSYAVQKDGALYRVIRADAVDLGTYTEFGGIVAAVDADAGTHEVLLQITQPCGIIPVTTQAAWPSGRSKPFRVRCDLKYGNGIALSDTVRSVFRVDSGTSVSNMRSYDWFWWEQGTLDPNYLSWTTSRDPDAFFGIKATNTNRQKYIQFRNNKWDNFVMLDGPNPNNVSVTGAASGTGGAVRLTVTHTLNWAEGEQVKVASVGGTTEANGNRRIHIVDSTHIELTGVPFVHAYTSGGTVSGLEFGWILLDDLQDAPTADNEALGNKNIQITNFGGPADGSPIGFSKLFHVGAKVVTKEAGGLVGANNFNSGVEVGWGQVTTKSDVTLATGDQNVGGIQIGFYGEVIDAYIHHLELSGFGDIPVQVANYRQALVEKVTAIDSHGFSSEMKRVGKTPRHITWLNCRQVNQYRTSGIVGWNITSQDGYSGAIQPIQMGSVRIDGPESRMDFYNAASIYSSIRRVLFAHVEANPFYLKARIAINDGTDAVPWLYDGLVGGNQTPAGLVYIACGRLGVTRPKVDLVLPLSVRGKTANSGSGKTAYKVVQIRKGANVEVSIDMPVIDMAFTGDGLASGKLKLVEHSLGAQNEDDIVYVGKETGTFPVTVTIPAGAGATATVAWDVSAAAMKTALEALATVGAGGIDSVVRARNDDSIGFNYDITFALATGERLVTSTDADVTVSRQHKYNEPSHESGRTRMTFQNLTGATAPVAESWDADADLVGPYRSRDWDTTGAPADLVKQQYAGTRPAKLVADSSAGGAAPKYVGLVFRGNGNVTSTGVGDVNGFEVTVPDDFTATKFGYSVQVQAGNVELVVLDPADSYNRLATTGVIACPATGSTNTALAASLGLMKGQRVFLGWAASDATTALAGEASGLPYGLVGKITAPGSPVPAAPGAPTFGSVGKAPSLLLSS